MVRGAGFPAQCMPWDPDFNPAHEYMTSCPVWVSFKALPPFLAPLLYDIATIVGKVFYCPQLDSMMLTRDVQVCIMWSFTDIIPTYLLFGYGLHLPFVYSSVFPPFQMLVYICRQLGHCVRAYASVWLACKLVDGAFDSLQARTSSKCSHATVPLGIHGTKQSTYFQQAPLKQMKFDWRLVFPSPTTFPENPFMVHTSHKDSAT